MAYVAGNGMPEEVLYGCGLSPIFPQRPNTLLGLKRMLVYHFISAQYGLEGIRNRRLKVSRIMELNDPFEFLGVNLSDRRFRKALRDTKEELSKSKGILCFSESWRNPVLWSHYADRHRGLCLGFEVSNSLIGKVEYVDLRFPAPSAFDEAFMRKLLFTKFRHWEYEQEQRIYIELEEHEDGIYYADFSDEFALRTVIVGDQSNVTRAELAQALGDLDPEVESFKARAGFNDFEVVRQRNNAKWA